jgi:hypothetical protein
MRSYGECRHTGCFVRPSAGPSTLASLLCVALIIALRLTAPGTVGWLGLGAVCAILSIGDRFRAVLGMIVRFTILSGLLLALVGIGRTAGGADPDEIWTDSTARLAWLAVAFVSAGTIRAFVVPDEALRLLDGLRCPRSAGYVLLSVLTMTDFARSAVERQVALLRLKGLIVSTLSSRLRGYYRILAPFVVVLLTRQATHAQSLFERGFFERCRTPPGLAGLLRRTDAAWLSAVSSAVLMSFLLALWIGR